MSDKVNLFSSSSTLNALHQQQQQLEDDLLKTKSQEDGLLGVVEETSYQLGALQESCRTPQDYLEKTPLKSSIPNDQKRKALEQMKQLNALRIDVEQGVVIKKLGQEYEQRNVQIGKINSQAKGLEAKVDEMEKLIPKMQELLKKRRQNVQESQQIVDGLK